MNTSQLTILICHCVIYSIFRVNIRNWWIRNPFILPYYRKYLHHNLSYFTMEQKRKKDSWVNHLSEAFENLSGNPKLELEVLTININEGHNSELMEQCQILREYAQYVDCVRRYAKEFELIDAIEQAVDECIQRNILSEFLRKNKAEVIAMSIFEYDKEEEERKLRKAEYEAGVESGIAEGKRLAQKKEGTIALSRLGLPVEQIAMALQVDVELAKQWIGDK